MIDSMSTDSTTTRTADVAHVGWRNRLRLSLFPVSDGEALTWRRALLLAAAVLAGTAISLARTRGHGAFDSMWAEDGNVFYNNALNLNPLKTFAKGLNGYFVLLPRLIAAVAVIAPVAWGPVMMSTGAALATAVFALAVYLASGAHLRSTLLRLLVAAPVVACPVGALSTPNNVATLQFVALYATFWMLLWSPSTRVARVFAVAVVLLTGLSTILVVAVAPLVLLRLFVKRDRWSLILASAVCGTAALQMAALKLGITSRGAISHPRLDPVWAVLEFFGWGLPYSILGESWLAPPANHTNGIWDTQPAVHTGEHAALIMIAYVIVVAAVVIAAFRFTRPAWGLVVVAGAQSVVMLAVEVMAMGYQVDTYLVPEMILLGTIRYLVPVTLLVITTMAALLRPDRVDTSTPRRADRWRLPGNAWPVVAYTVLVLVICVANLRTTNPRSMVPSWSAEVAKVRATCVATNASVVPLHYGGSTWRPSIKVPCGRLR
jgi:hypothetical protein